MNINDAFPSNYLKAADLAGREITVEIAHVQLETIGDEEKPIVYFNGKTRGLVLNKTNANTIAQQLGSETDEWAGKRIILFASQTDFQGKQVPCVRVKLTPLKKETEQLTDDIPF